jgi:hypothetical protein
MLSLVVCPTQQGRGAWRGIIFYSYQSGSRCGYCVRGKSILDAGDSGPGHVKKTGLNSLPKHVDT